MPLTSIKLVSGHSSSTVVQRYVDNTDTAKIIAAQALSSAPPSSGKRQREQQPDNNGNKASRVNNVYNINIAPNTTINSLFSESNYN